MKKFLLTILLIITLPCYAETFLTGGVNYNVDTARQELQNSPVEKLPQELVSQNLLDKDYEKNIVI